MLRACCGGDAISRTDVRGSTWVVWAVKKTEIFLYINGEWPPLSHLTRTSNLFRDDARCVGEFRTTFRIIPAFVRLVRNSKPQY
jgi:hypothetical protein